MQLGLAHSFHKATGNRWNWDIFWWKFVAPLAITCYFAVCVIAMIDSFTGGNLLGLGNPPTVHHAIQIFYHGHGVTVEKLHGHVIVKR